MDQTIYCLQKTHFTYKETHRLKVKGWKKIIHANTIQKKSRQVATFLSDKIDLKLIRIKQPSQATRKTRKKQIQNQKEGRNCEALRRKKMEWRQTLRQTFFKKHREDSNKIRDEKGNTTTDTIEILKIIRDYCKQLHANKFDNQNRRQTLRHTHLIKME